MPRGIASRCPSCGLCLSGGAGCAAARHGWLPLQQLRPNVSALYLGIQPLMAASPFLWHQPCPVCVPPGKLPTQLAPAQRAQRASAWASTSAAQTMGAAEVFVRTGCVRVGGWTQTLLFDALTPTAALATPLYSIAPPPLPAAYFVRLLLSCWRRVATRQQQALSCLSCQSCECQRCVLAVCLGLCGC